MTVNLERRSFPTTDPRLGWAPVHDPRSRAFGIAQRLGAVEEKPKRWRTGAVLDQGSEGACVGHAWVGEAIASPRPDYATTSARASAVGFEVYRRAKQIDEWPGEDYSGTSVLAGAKAMRERGLIGGYYWSFGIDQLWRAVIAEGPAVIGIPWYDSMYATRPGNLVEVDGDLVGGHAILLTGYHPNRRFNVGGRYVYHRAFEWRNSWGHFYGRGGTAWIRYEDLRDLLAEWGEACIPVQRSLVRFSG